MFKYIIKRIGYIVITLFLVLTVNFLLLQLMPGGPFEDPKLSDAQKTILENKYGLNDPVPVQYTRYMTGVLKGDFGTSFKLQNQEVSDLVLSRIPYTIKPGAIALVVGVTVGIILGAIACNEPKHGLGSFNYDYCCTRGFDSILRFSIFLTIFYL